MSYTNLVVLLCSSVGGLALVGAAAGLGCCVFCIGVFSGLHGLLNLSHLFVVLGAVVLGHHKQSAYISIYSFLLIGTQ